MRQRTYGRKAEKNQKWFIWSDKSTDRHTKLTLDEWLVSKDSDDEKDCEDDDETQQDQQQ